MTDSKKTRVKEEFLTPGQMKVVAATAISSIPTKIRKEFADKLGRNNYLASKLEAFWKELLKEDVEVPETLSFVVGEVFRHRDSNGVPQWHGDNFKSWIWEKAKDRMLPATFDRALSEYVLPKNMNDTAIQNAAKSVPMSEDEFLQILYLLIIKPELGKQFLNYELRRDKVYVFHVKLNSGKAVALSVYWDGAVVGRRVDADRWDDWTWSAGRVFLSSATV